jgi:hypothetical protein
MSKKTYTKCIILLSILTLGIIAGLPLVVHAEPPAAENHSSFSSGQPITYDGLVGGGILSEIGAQGPVAQGDVGSGWKPDVKMTDSSNDSVNPSMATYINSTTGAVILYAAMQHWSQWNVTGRWEIYLYRSFNGGNSWGGWWHGWWSAERSMINPSVAVSPYNGTIFIAVQSVPWSGHSNDIHVWRIDPNTGGWQFYAVANTVDEEINPHLVAEYGYGTTDWLYISYEVGLDASFRSVYFARSTDWGQTWTTMPIATWAFPTYTQSCITDVQGNIYIAYRQSGPSYSDTGWIDVAYSTDFGNNWGYAYNVSGVMVDASWPTIAGSHTGAWYQPATVMVAYEYNTTLSNHDIYYAWSLDGGFTWVGGSDYYHQIATSGGYEEKPELAVDGMGTELTVGGNFHLDYIVSSSIYYTQLPYWDIPIFYGGHTFWGYYFGWTSPGKVTNNNAAVSGSYRPPGPAIVTFQRNVGGTLLWEPCVAWTDFRGPGPSFYDIYSSITDTDFSITFSPSSQTVVAGKSISYYVTVNRLSGPINATAYLNVQTLYPSYVYQSSATYNIWSLTPTGTAKLTLTTSNLLAPGGYQFTATATIGGYRRMVSIPYTVTAPPTLTLNLSPTTVARGQTLTLSGQLTAGTTTPQTIYIYYRLPHQTGTWKLATTLTTNAAGAFNVGAPVPNSLPTGMYDLAAFWVNTSTGSYATSPITVFTVT